MTKRKRFFSIEYCQKAECTNQNVRACLCIAKEEVTICSEARVKEMLDSWTCDRCRVVFGLLDTRHQIPVSPQIEEGTKTVETYCRIITVCDRCLMEHEKPLELYGVSP